jgi:hypothetical protein
MPPGRACHTLVSPYRRPLEDGVIQDVFQIDVGVDSVDDVRRKGRALEGRVLSRAVQLYLNNEVVVINGKVVFKLGMRTLLRDFGERAL